MELDIIKELETTIKDENVSEEEKMNIIFYIHYLKTIQKPYRKKWLMKRCEFVCRKENTEKPVEIKYEGHRFSFLSYGHACFSIMKREIEKGKIRKNG